MVLTLPDRTIDLDAGVVTLAHGPPVELVGPELPLLRALCANAGRTIPRGELIAAVWAGRAVQDRAVDLVVAHVRAKLGPSRARLVTVRGVGYRWAADEPALPAPRPEASGRRLSLPTGTADLGRLVFVDASGVVTALTASEAALLELLAGRGVVLRDEILRTLWGAGSNDRALEGMLRRLRPKLDRPPVQVLTVIRGVGLRLEERLPDVDPAGASFVARPELADVYGRVARGVVLTLVGAGGMGKTRLAAEVARRWSDAHPDATVRVCALASAGSDRTLDQGVATGLGLASGPELEGRIGAALARMPRDSLVVLDNFEQLLPWRERVDRWAAAGPALVVTSREPLGLRREVVVSVGPLDEGAATALFSARARRPLDEEATASVVAALGGVPLAIELAAARTDDLSADTLLARLGRPLDVLVRRGDGDSQHSTLRAAIDGSWDLLDDDARAVWRVASTFAAPFTAEDLAGVAGLSDDRARRRLDALASKSLVVRADGRYSLLPLLAAYADEKRALEDPDAVDRHARWFARSAGSPAGAVGRGDHSMDRVEAVTPELVAAAARTRDPVVRGALLRPVAMSLLRDRADERLVEPLTAAVEAGAAHAAVLCAGIAYAHRLGGRFLAAREWLDRAERAATPEDPGAVWAVDLVAATLALDEDRRADAADRMRRHLRSTGDLREAAESHESYLRFLVASPCRDDDAVSVGLAYAEALGDPRLTSQLHGIAARHALWTDAEAARPHADRALAEATRARWPWGQAAALLLTARADLATGRFAAILARSTLPLDLGPDSLLARQLRALAGIAALALDRLDDAGAALSAEDPEHFLPWTFLQRRLGRPDAALDASDRWVEAGGARTFAWISARVGALTELGRVAEAERALEGAEGPGSEGIRRLVALARAELDGDRSAARAEAEAFLAGLPTIRCDDGRVRARGVGTLLLAERLAHALRRR